jgi:D-3-phosphoglycerate dehydrogenase
VLVTSYDEVTEAVMAACPRLQVIACTRANPVNIDTQAAQARGIRCSTPRGAMPMPPRS